LKWRETRTRGDGMDMNGGVWKGRNMERIEEEWGKRRGTSLLVSYGI